MMTPKHDEAAGWIAPPRMEGAQRRGRLRPLASRDFVSHSARDPPPRDAVSARKRLHRARAGGRACRSHGSSRQRARRVPAGASRAPRAPDPGHGGHRRVRRLEDRGPRHQFPPDRSARSSRATSRRKCPRSSRATTRCGSDLGAIIATELAGLRSARGDDRGTSAFEWLHAALTRSGTRAGRRRRRTSAPPTRAPSSPPGRQGLARRRRAAGGRVPRAGADRVGARRPPRLDLGRSGYDRRDGAGPRLQRARQRRHRGADRPARPEGRRDGAVRAPAAAGSSGRHEHERRLGIRQEHAAPAATRARRRHRRALERIRAHQPRHLAQAAPRLRHARRRPTSTAARSRARNCRSSTRSSTATWRARPSAAR